MKWEKLSDKGLISDAISYPINNNNNNKQIIKPHLLSYFAKHGAWSQVNIRDNICQLGHMNLALQWRYWDSEQESNNTIFEGRFGSRAPGYGVKPIYKAFQRNHSLYNIQMAAFSQRFQVEITMTLCVTNDEQSGWVNGSICPFGVM